MGTRIAISFLAYLVFVATFAGVYAYSIPNHFKFTTAADEPAYKATLTQTANLVKERVLKRILEFDPDGNRVANARQYGDLEALLLLQAQASDKSLTVRYVEHGPDTITWRADIANQWIATCIAYDRGATGRSVSYSDSSVYCPFRLVVSPAPGEFAAKKSTWVHVLIPKTEMKFSDIVDPERGIRQGLFFRMAYFSAVTATTLGYGEIVPLTVEARSLVAFESVFGLLLMGSLLAWITKGEYSKSFSELSVKIDSLTRHSSS